jgi:alkylation response protein AidB-like acyl-CoA dehydrogenase
METRLLELGLDALGPRAEVAEGPEAEHGGELFGDYLYARASMIYAGTNEIQKNILTKAVLRL